MRLLYLLAYLAIEIGAFTLMAMTLGVGWAVLITLAAAVVGVVLLRHQGRKVFAELRRASRNEIDPRGPLTDTALLAASSVLLVVPGIVTTITGMVLMVGPVRRMLRPVVVAAGARRFVTSMNRVGVFATGSVVGGRIVDGTVVEDTGDGPDRASGSGGDGPEDIHRRLPRGR